MSTTSGSRLGLLRHPNFARLWTAATVSLFGTQVSQIAIPFIAAVVLQASPAEVGLLTTIEFLPFLLFTLPAGVWVDRFPKRRILILGDLVRAAMLVSIPIAAAANVLTIWQLYVVGFVNGIATVFFDVADQSYLPTILERDELVEGNSKLQISQSSAQILGQPFGGGIVAVLSAPVAILVDAASYLGSAGLIVSIRERLGGARSTAAAKAPDPATAVGPDLADGPTTESSVAAETAASADPVTPGGGMRSQIMDGLRYILRHEYLGNIAATTATSNLFGNIAFAIFPVFTYRVLLLRPEQVGTIGGFGGAGVLLGALAAGRIQARLGVGWTIVLTALAFGPIAVLIALATPETAFWLLAVALFVGGFNGVVYNIAQVSLRQAITPAHFLGRMNATMRFLVWGTIPVGSVLGAALSEFLPGGVRTTVWVSALLSFLPCLPVLFSSVRRVKEMPTVDPDGPTPAGA